MCANTINILRNLPACELKQDLHGLKLLTDDKNSVPIDISKLKSKNVDPATFIPKVFLLQN